MDQANLDDIRESEPFCKELLDNELPCVEAAQMGNASVVGCIAEFVTHKKTGVKRKSGRDDSSDCAGLGLRNIVLQFEIVSLYMSFAGRSTEIDQSNFRSTMRVETSHGGRAWERLGI